MHSKTYAGIILCLLLSCNGNFTDGDQTDTPALALDNEVFFTSVQDIPAPPGYSRLQVPLNSFGNWLRKISLRKNKIVYLYNGRMKANQDAQFAVLDISVGNRDLQQCADAVIRLRADQLFQAKRFEEIAFTDNAGTTYKFYPPYTQLNFDKYLPKVFGMCGTASLSKQMKAIQIENVLPGDALVRGGFPGHAVIVMDVATNPTGEKIFLLAQSYMPAQDIHILKNPGNADLSPWYKLNAGELIKTPEYIFTKNELKRW